MATSGKIHGRFASGLLGGFDIGNDTTSIEYDSATQMAKSTGMNGATDETFTIGQNDNKVSLKGWFDDAAGTGLYTALAALRDTFFVATFLPAGDAAQGYAALMGATQVPSDMKINSPVGGTVTLDANFQISGELDCGIVLAQRAVLTGTGAQVVIGASIDNLAPSSAGAAAHFHITTTPSGGGTVSAFKVQHSTDNVTFTDLLTSGLTGTVTSSDRQITSSTTTVNRYVRAVATLTNTDTATLFVAFKRF